MLFVAVAAVAGEHSAATAATESHAEREEHFARAAAIAVISLREMLL